MKFTQYLPVCANRKSGEHHKNSLTGGCPVTCR